MCSLTYQDHKTVQFDLNKLKQVIDEIAEYGAWSGLSAIANRLCMSTSKMP